MSSEGSLRAPNAEDLITRLLSIGVYACSGLAEVKLGMLRDCYLRWRPKAGSKAVDPMVQSFSYLAALALGVAFGLYLPLNSLTARVVQSPFLANVAFFAFGLVTALVVAWLAGNRTNDYARFSEVPWWMYLSGVLSGLMILGSAFLIPQIGSGPFFVLFVAGQVVTGVIIGHFGWFRLAPDAATLRSFAGLCLVIVGAWLVTSR